MADARVTDLTELTSPADADLLYAVSVGSAPPRDRKLTVGSLKTVIGEVTPPSSTGGKTKPANPHTQTTDGTPKELFANGTTTRIAIPNDTTMGFVAYIVGRRIDGGAEESGFYKLEGSITRNGGTVALHSGVFRTTISEDDASWQVTFEADDVNKALVFRVTGAVGKTISWQGWIQIVEVTG